MRLSAWIASCAAVLLALLLIGNALNPERLRNHFSSISITAGSYTNCEIALSLIIQQELTINAALSPNTLGNISEDEPCELLERYYADHALSSDVYLEGDSRLRLRYIWGVRSIQGLFVSALPIDTVQKGIASLTFFCIAIIALLAFRRDKKTGLSIAPFLVAGAVFSGAHDASALPIAIAYLWAWLAGILFIKAMSANRDKEFATIAGMISAYLWFMEGHFLLLITLIGLLSYLLHKANHQQSQTAFRRSVRNILYAHFGFILLMLIFVLFKLSFFGSDAVLGSFSSAITERSSNIDANGSSISLQTLFHRLLFVGFQYTATYESVWLWKTVLVSSFVVLLSLILFVFLQRKEIEQSKYYLLLLSILVAYLSLRFVVVTNHTYIHALLMSRYLFIPIASIWSAAVYLYLTKKTNIQLPAPK